MTEKEKNNTLLVELASNNYISKDKIRTKIEEIEKYKGNTVERSTINEYECAINFLEELLK